MGKTNSKTALLLRFEAVGQSGTEHADVTRHQFCSAASVLCARISPYNSATGISYQPA